LRSISGKPPINLEVFNYNSQSLQAILRDTHFAVSIRLLLMLPSNKGTGKVHRRTDLEGP